MSDVWPLVARIWMQIMALWNDVWSFGQFFTVMLDTRIWSFSQRRDEDTAMLCKPAYTMDCSGIGSTSWQIDRWGHGAGGSYSYTHFMVGYLFEFELVNRYKQRVPLLLLIVFFFHTIVCRGRSVAVFDWQGTGCLPLSSDIWWMGSSSLARKGSTSCSRASFVSPSPNVKDRVTE